MELAVIGTGYVGLVSGVCFAELGNRVVCVDKIQDKVDMLRRGEVPIYEPGLQAIMQRNMQEGRLSFTADIADAVKAADIVILAVGTPSLPTGEADLSFIHEAARNIALAMEGSPKIIATKSTVPVGTNESIARLIGSLTQHPYEVASVPEFLREGTAVRDTLNPDRIVIGTNSEWARGVLTELHRPLTGNIIATDIRSAEMIKYASNAFLATKISFINEIANICEKVGADVTMVAEGMGYDKRIGASFLKPGIGYGGSCFPKDTLALIQIAGHVDYDFKLLRAVVEVNQDQRFNIIRKLEAIFGQLQGRTIGIWGLAFKPETDDIRDAPAYEIITTLLQQGARVQAYDPIAADNFKRKVDHPAIRYCESARSAAWDADALCILTEWQEFQSVSVSELQTWLRSPNVIDGRNVFSEADIANSDLVYYSVGRPSLNRGIREGAPRLQEIY